MNRVFQSFLRALTTIPAILGGLVPVFKACPPCPVCMPIYCGILSILGLELADYGMYLVPIMLASMTLTIGSIGYQAHRYHRNYLICAVAILSCTIILSGKFLFDFMPVVYAGMIGLVSSIVINRQMMKRIRTCCDHHASH